MKSKEHLKLPIYKENIERFKRTGGGKKNMPKGRDKGKFSQDSIKKSKQLITQHSQLKKKFLGKIDPSLIYEIEITQKMHIDTLIKNLNDMSIQVISVAENKQGFWIVFNEKENLNEFQRKLGEYGSKDGHNYDFFNVIENFQTIPIEKKIGQQLQENPIGKEGDFVDIELWKMDKKLNEKFIKELKDIYTSPLFRITDTLITNSFVLIRAKLTKEVFDEIIELNEIARIDRPSLPQFNPAEFMRPDISDIVLNSPPDDATGILVIDSGVISNHPMLEKCIGAEENFQSEEREIQDTVGHGTSVAGCAAYGDIEASLVDKEFTPSNWIFSTKIMYAEKDWNGNLNAIYDPEKLVEHQFKDAVISFLSNPTYRIKVINISLGNVQEVWQKHYTRQLPFAALIDELALQFPNVTFIVSTGNQSPLDYFNSITEIKDSYPAYLTEEEDFKIINPATSALALTVGSIAQEPHIETERYGAESIKLSIAEHNQPSPFTRVGIGINGMVKPELVEYGGNLILSEEHGRIIEDKGGKIPLLNNSVVENIMKFDYGTSFSAPKVAYLAGKIANQFPQKSSNFIKNMLLVGADYPFVPNKKFYNVDTKEKAIKKHLSTTGYGLSSFDKAIHSFDNRTVLWDEGKIGLNQIKVYSLQLPEIFFQESGKKKITVVLTFNPETRSTRGDSYLGNHLEFHLFHTINPNFLVEKYGVISDDEASNTPDDIQKFEINFIPGSNTLKAGCHQKAWKEFHRDPKTLPKTPISLVLLNVDKWLHDESHIQDYCISVTFEHEKEIELYNVLRANIKPRVRVR